jgi:hypothetical protein
MSVFANGREVSGKAQPNQVIAGFPSVCMSPPPPPAGPVPIPYPMFTQANRTTQGTTTVKIKRKEVGKKNATKYKDSKGNEPATRSFGMDVVSHTLSGASKHQAYSFDVKAQNAGVDRFLDLTTTNHSNSGTAIAINTAGANPATITNTENPCEELGKRNEDSREEMKKHKNKEVQKAGNESTTITHSLFTTADGGKVSVERACSRKVIARDPTWSSGVALDPQAPDMKSGDKWVSKTLDSEICGGGKHTYKEASPGLRPHNSHTEARILEDLWAKHKPGKEGKIGKIVMNIQWQTFPPDPAAAPGAKKEPVFKKVPCEHCRDLICAAIACFTILICDEKNKPVDQKKVCEA